MKNERRKYNRALVDFLGPKLGGLWVKNLRLHRAKKEAKVFRLVQGRRKIEAILTS